MPAATHNLTIERGATYTQRLTWKDPAGTAINLTGYTARMQLRPRIGGPVLIELTTENGRIALGGSAGTIDLTIAAADTTTLPTSTVKYDLELISAGGLVYRLIEGAVTITPNVTV